MSSLLSNHSELLLHFIQEIYLKKSDLPFSLAVVVASWKARTSDDKEKPEGRTLEASLSPIPEKIDQSDIENSKLLNEGKSLMESGKILTSDDMIRKIRKICESRRIKFMQCSIEDGQGITEVYFLDE